MFGDWGWHGARTQRQEQRFRAWVQKIAAAERTAVLEFGAGTAVPTVRHFSEWFASRTQGRLIRVNPRDVGIPRQIEGWEIPLGASEAIERLLG